MEIKQEIITMLNMLPQPAFLVQRGVICHTNAAAGVYLLQKNTPIAPMLADYAADYAAFTDGTLYLALQLGNARLGASITKMADCELFTVEQPTEQAQLQALSLAAQQLRMPMVALMAEAEQHFDSASGNRSMHQLLRIINNMSDAQHFARPEYGKMELSEVGSVLAEVLEKVQSYLIQVNTQLYWELPNEPVYTMLDRDKLERALLNLLTNAIKFSDGDRTIHVRLKKGEHRLLLSVTAGNTLPDADIFHRFQRQPMIEDPQYGLGLGMVLIRSAALAHGGSVLSDRPDPQHSRITLALPIRTSSGSEIRSPALHVDYAGERDHCLVELADVLPTEFYRTDNKE